MCVMQGTAHVPGAEGAVPVEERRDLALLSDVTVPIAVVELAEYFLKVQCCRAQKRECVTINVRHVRDSIKQCGREGRKYAYRSHI